MLTYYDAVEYFNKKLTRMLARYNPKRGIVIRLVSESNYTGLSVHNVKSILGSHLKSKGLHYRSKEVDRKYISMHHKHITTDLVIKLINN